MKKVTIVVPTYWTWPNYYKGKKEQSVFDHPTPLNLTGTLARTLESFRKLSYRNFDVLVITSATHNLLKEKAETRVQEIVDQFKEDLDIKHFSYSKLKKLKSRICELGYQKFSSFLRLDNYGYIRNLQLLLPYINGTEFVVGIDDDEVINDKNYLEKAVKYAGQDFRGQFVAGVAGYYLDKEGNHRLNCQGQAELKNLFAKKEYIMDSTYSMIDEQPERLVKTPVVLGGNMVVHRSVIKKVPFDPYNTRGEDIDYLINAKMEGLHFYLDKDLRIYHFPPVYPDQNELTYIKKLKQDILRFIYEKKKIELAQSRDDVKNINIRELMPYPGIYFGDRVYQDGEEELKRALIKAGFNDSDAAIEAKSFVNEAVERAQKLAPKYFEFRKIWQEFFLKFGDLDNLRHEIISKMEDRS